MQLFALKCLHPSEVFNVEIVSIEVLLLLVVVVVSGVFFDDTLINKMFMLWRIVERC